MLEVKSEEYIHWDGFWTLLETSLKILETGLSVSRNSCSASGILVKTIDLSNVPFFKFEKPFFDGF